MNHKIYTVSELTAEIKSTLENQYASLWLTGEISNFKAHSSGHFYFSLKDAEAQIQAVMFRGLNRFIRFQIEDGLQVVVNARVTVYPPRGNYQVVVEFLEPKGIGALQLAFEQLKRKLEEEGLFEVSSKKPLPFLPRKIGIVTSPTGAAIRDLIHVLKRRCPPIEILLNPVNVQGEGCAQEIASAIEELNRCEDIDLLIVGRGGGSLEDLWAFNTEVVARAIFASRIPVISAVGHEIDYTIADFVADLRAPTPSAAAELAVPIWQDLAEALSKQQKQLQIATLDSLLALREKLTFQKSHLKHPKARIEELEQRLDELGDRMRIFIQHRLTGLRQVWSAKQQILEHLSPLSILERGYAIVFQRGGKIPLKEASSVELGATLEIQLARGLLGVTVNEKK